MDQSRAVHKMCLKCGRKWSNWYTCTCFHEPVSPLCHPSLEKSHLGMKSDDKYLFFSSPSLCGKHQKCQDPALTSIYIPQNWHFPCAGHATSCTHLPTWALPQSHPTHKKNNNQPKKPNSHGECKCKYKYEGPCTSYKPFWDMSWGTLDWPSSLAPCSQTRPCIPHKTHALHLEMNLKNK